MSTRTTTNITDVRAFASAVRDGDKLTPAQREHLAGLLQNVTQAATLAPRAEQR